MPESGTYGSERGPAGNSRPYRECRAKPISHPKFLLTGKRTGNYAILRPVEPAPPVGMLEIPRVGGASSK